MNKKLFQTIQYFKHLYKSKNEHHLHSPFLFEWYSHNIKTTLNKENYNEIEKVRKSLLKNQSKISVLDFGAGSSVHNLKKRTISEIAKNSLKPAFQCRAIASILHYSKPKSIIELGTSFGITTSYLANNHPQTIIYTLEGSPETLKIAIKTFETLSIENIKTIEGDFNLTLPNLISELTTIDAVFIDGNHQYHSTLQYFNMLIEKSHENTVLIFDDIYWSEEMQNTWKEIVNHTSVQLSIDFYWFGVVFFRSKQPKQHFILKL